MPTPTPRIDVPHQALSDLCRVWKVRRLSLFGSVLRDDFRDESDVDVLVEFQPGCTPGLIAMDGLRRALSRMFGGRPVDLVTLPALHPLLRDEIMGSLIEQFAA